MNGSFLNMGSVWFVKKMSFFFLELGTLYKFVGSP
jgi:hypothetical protein